MDKYIVLNNGIKMPRLGVGVDTLKGEDCILSVVKAIEYGYRLIDTASCYNNEEEVGVAINDCIKRGIVKRKDLFITSKAPYHIPGFKETIRGYEESLKKLNLEYLDLFLLHSPYWNSFSWKADIINSWSGMIELYKNKKVKSIGVANFNSPVSMDLIETSSLMKPHVNQFEIHPQHQNTKVIEWCKKNLIQTESWGALNQGRLFDSKIMSELAEKYNKTIAQIAIRWNLQTGNCVLIRSTKESHLKSNFNVWDFHLSEEDMIKINSLDGGSWSQIHDDYINTPIAFTSTKTFWDKMDKQINGPKKKIVRLFGFIPFLTITKQKNKQKFYLFNFIPILTIKGKHTK